MLNIKNNSMRNPYDIEQTATLICTPRQNFAVRQHLRHIRHSFGTVYVRSHTCTWTRTNATAMR
jgi:hypothetical protein